MMLLLVPWLVWAVEMSAAICAFGRAARTWERRGVRRMVWIARKANTEPVEGFIALSMMLGGWTLLSKPNDTGPLLFPLGFGWALVLLGVCGMAGLWMRIAGVRATFGFGGVIVRAWMALLYFVHDCHDLAWLSFGVSALALAWLSVRIVCDATARYVNRLQRQHRRRSFWERVLRLAKRRHGDEV